MMFTGTAGYEYGIRVTPRVPGPYTDKQQFFVYEDEEDRDEVFSRMLRKPADYEDPIKIVRPVPEWQVQS